MFEPQDINPILRHSLVLIIGKSERVQHTDAKAMPFCLEMHLATCFSLLFFYNEIQKKYLCLSFLEKRSKITRQFFLSYILF